MGARSSKVLYKNQQHYEVEGQTATYEEYVAACRLFNVMPHITSPPKDRGVREGDEGPTYCVNERGTWER